MNAGNLVSVLMPVFNAEHYIKEAIESILNQTYANVELLIADDLSSDRSVDIIKTFSDSRIRFFQNKNNLGAFENRSNLLKHARGEFVTFQDADDYSDTRRLELQLNALLRDRAAGMVGCQVSYFNKHGVTIKTSTKPLTYEAVLAEMNHSNVIGGAIMMIRKEVLDHIGGYRNYFRRLSYQDYDLSLLIAEKYKCFNLPDVLYYYRQHEKSLSKTINCDRIIAREVVMHLAQQRKLRGYDDLQAGYPERVDAYFNTLRMRFLDDPSLVYREYAANFMYNKLYVAAINAASHAVAKRPLKFVNWRTLQYCVRKSITNSLLRNGA